MFFGVTSVLSTILPCVAIKNFVYACVYNYNNSHTHRLDAALNNGLRLVSGCIRSTPTFMLPVVSGIMPPDIRRNKQCLALSRRAEADDQHALHNIVAARTPVRKRLQSRHLSQSMPNNSPATLMKRPTGHGQKGPGKRDGTSHAAD